MALNKSNCKECSKEFEYHSSASNGRFCSCKCSSAYRSKATLEKNKQKLLAGTLKDNNRRAIKQVMIECFNVKKECNICGITEWFGKPLPMILDHIDGNATHNKLSNLRLLCSNCDSQLATYKRKNKTGRSKRI